MRKSLGFTIVLALLSVSSVSGAQLNLDADPLWRSLMLKAQCTASCGSNPSVSCSTSGTCTAVDQDCSANPPQQGYVTCGSTTIACPKVDCDPPPSCDEFDFGGCDYSWDPVRLCCVAPPFGGDPPMFCPDTCSSR